jgi:DNA-directed RNA polymerase specialized sigma24 family protein
LCGIYICVGASPRRNTADAGTGQQAGPGSESFEDLYGALYEPMARLAYLLTGSGSAAEDLVQDCFAGLHQHWFRVRRPAAYLRTSVVNACRAFHRRRRRERVHFP